MLREGLSKVPVPMLPTQSSWISGAGSGVWAAGRAGKAPGNLVCSQVREFHIHGPPTFLIFNRVLFPTQHTPPNIAELFSGPEGKAVHHSHGEARSVAPGEDGGRYQLAPPQRACGGLFSAPSPLCPGRTPGLESEALA